jgi:hypothetical protein
MKKTSLLSKITLSLMLILGINEAQAQTIFVNQAATGANNGSSWTNAYVSLGSALSAVATSGKTIWVASGTYKPSTSNRDASFTFNYGLTSVYGGFVGNETLLSQRNPTINITTLSGDLAGNDNTSLLPTEATRQDNSYHVIKIRGNAQNVIIDGFTISGGNANGAANNLCSVPADVQSYHLRGGAILANPYVSGNAITAFVRNCTLQLNSGLEGGVYASFTPCGVQALSADVNFENCIVKNNYSGALAAMVFNGSSGYSIFSKGSIVNCLFYNNTSVAASCLYLGTSTVNSGTATGIDVDIINSTFANNVGANGNVVTMSNASNSRIRNSIIYGNGSTTPFAVTGSASVVNNSIVEGGQLSGTNANPQFTNSATNTYTLQSNSPAINVGNNSYISLTTDLNGDARIYNTTVDLGAYEFSACEAPTNIQISSATGTSATVTWTFGSVSADLVYVIAGQPIASGTTISGLLTNTYALTNLNPSTSYDVYLKRNCSSGLSSGYSLATTFRTSGPIYVNHAATGNGSGGSWTDAFTTLDDALKSLTSTITEIRVAQGTYKPSTSGLTDPRKATFAIPNGAKIYGGFNGTETTLAERNPTLNITKLNGDLNGNDNGTINYTNGSRSDNAYHVVSLMGNSSTITIDGFTISGGNANGTQSYTLGVNSYDDKMAGAIYVSTKNATTVYGQFTNCIIENNTGEYVGVYASVSLQSSTSIQVDFDKCTIRYNQSSDVFSNMFFKGFKNASTNRTTQNTISNCLFHNNVSNGTSSQGSSCITSYQDATAGGAYTTAYVTIANCTFTNNTGPGGRVLSLLYASNTTVRNSILYNNGSTTPLYLLPTSGTIPTGSNNIIQGGQLGGLNVNPLFVNSTSDFQLSAGSPAINTGTNTYASGTDLLGNPRIYNTIVDMGPYEYGSSVLGINSSTLVSDFVIYPNPATTTLEIGTAEEINKIEIYALDGKKVLECNTKQIDVSHIPKGLYMLKIATYSNKTVFKKFKKD